MATVILVRHGRSTANTSGVLAGRATGITLDETGEQQAARVAERLAAIPLVGVVSSPLERCRLTARAILERQEGGLELMTEPDVIECDYGEWEGQEIKDLAKQDLWTLVQTQPSSARFPGGESLAEMQHRTVAAVRRLDAAFEAEHGTSAVWALVSHGDPIKSVLADALGMHLDLFQRLDVHPGSASVVRHGTQRPAVIAVNTAEGDLGWLASKPEESDARVGGGDAS
ncbi:MSMEG_4193 family putative phosphomutase [Aeromicrobium terrae]|uniref:MSMEG_4193 family putative phosphomutase n=1 Tax=Aeromicrobium terrae TaxID=2498846 RepID=A0A5C8NJQ7_9ACTN|nr:MSMEG_4193 family putative phosphomutase [Aeromicrobium terrae]TXL61336.1 MSMEG_4193 family putative phosphomutase [Aeromicrobium terrae]